MGKVLDFPDNRSFNKQPDKQPSEERKIEKSDIKEIISLFQEELGDIKKDIEKLNTKIQIEGFDENREASKISDMAQSLDERVKKIYETINEKAEALSKKMEEEFKDQLEKKMLEKKLANFNEFLDDVFDLKVEIDNANKELEELF